MKLAIIGGRNFLDYDLVIESMKNAHVSEIVSGGAPGADTLAQRWAEEHNVPLKVFPANWKKYGPSAGPLRNTQIIEYCDAVLAFWDGKSPGTHDSIKKAKRARKPIKVVHF